MAGECRLGGDEHSQSEGLPYGVEGWQTGTQLRQDIDCALACAGASLLGIDAATDDPAGYELAVSDSDLAGYPDL